MDKYDVYADIHARTNGEIYLGIVGPVRTGKSTFIKRFMDIMVLPKMEDVYSKERAIDELPQSASGKTIMTTEPKFVPKEAATVDFAGDKKAKVRLIDCVGFMVKDAVGYLENDVERLVKTPWSEEPVPFSKAAEIGTRKVIREHSNIGIVVTTDGSIGDIERASYVPAEQQTVDECKEIGKPFIIIINSKVPNSDSCQELRSELEQMYQAPVIAMDCANLGKGDITNMMETILDGFPISRVNFFLPQWVEFLDKDHWLKKDLLQQVRESIHNIRYMKDVKDVMDTEDSQYINGIGLKGVTMETGEVNYQVNFDEKYYYQILSDLIGTELSDEYDLITTLRELAGKKNEIEKISVACSQVKGRGYGIVTPTREEIQIASPELIKHGNKYGVKIKATCPSIHLIQANIETEIAPIVGDEDQAKDLIRYIEGNAAQDKDGIFDTNIFGKTIRELVDDGISTKVNRLTEESQVKLQDTIQKVVNDSNGGLVCIII